MKIGKINNLPFLKISFVFFYQIIFQNKTSNKKKKIIKKFII